MGSGSSKESKAAARPDNNRHVSGSGQNNSNQASISQLSPQERQFAQIAQRAQRGSRPDIPILGLIRGADNGQSSPDRPRETKPERELRKTEKERLIRLKERERSMREEHVDGGYLVTLGVYSGVEDYSKAIVRQLQIERRLAPFWKGLNDHSSSWTEAQLVAAAQGLPIPEPDEIPPQRSRTGSQASSIPRSSDINMNNLTVPIGSRSQSHDSGSSANISPSRPMFSSPSPTSPSSPPSSTAQLFRGRAKTLASLATGSKNHSPDLTPQEIKLPKDSNVNGQPLEAYLYKDASECPICFMYYPPYLNKTRCCDQAICSECFVQIKRPDPHPPEHEQPNEQRPPEEEAELLVSEVASCPFCVTPEFGITYDPPPFRRGLAYSKQSNRNPLLNSTSAMSSSSSINTNGRRRTMSISATAPQVITTDRVRPDWAKKLADARAHVLRRSAAATALHNAAYVLGSQGDSQLRGLAGFRRRTSLFDTARGGASANGAGGLVLRAGQREGDDGNNDMYPARGSSRRTQVQDLEDLMMMEAIRLSLAAEEERKKKEDKEARKDAKKKAKEDKKEAKQAEKLAKKGGASSGPMYNAGPNDSSSTWESNDAACSNSNLLIGTMSEEQLQGKGKAPVQDFAGFNPLMEPTSTLNTEMTRSEDRSGPNEAKDVASSPTDDAQRHLEESRAMLQPTATASVPEPTRLSPHSRQMSDTPSVASSINDSSPSSAYVDFDQPSAAASDLDVSVSGHGFASVQTDDSPAATPALEPMVNFRSLAAMIGDEDRPRAGNEHVENAELASRINDYFQNSSNTSSPQPEVLHGKEGMRNRGDSGESNDSAPPPVYDGQGDQITPAPVAIVHDVDSKEIGNVNLLENVGVHQATQ